MGICVVTFSHTCDGVRPGARGHCTERQNDAKLATTRERQLADAGQSAGLASKGGDRLGWGGACDTLCHVFIGIHFMKHISS